MDHLDFKIERILNFHIKTKLYFPVKISKRNTVITFVTFSVTFSSFWNIEMRLVILCPLFGLVDWLARSLFSSWSISSRPDAPTVSFRPKPDGPDTVPVLDHVDDEDPPSGASEDLFWGIFCRSDGFIRVNLNLSPIFSGFLGFTGFSSAWGWGCQIIKYSREIV